VCFICNLDRALFEKEGKSFLTHTRVEHYIWNYMYFLVYLETKDKFEYNGTESYIYDKIEADDLSWFPIQRAKSLSEATQEEKEDVNAVINDKFIVFEKKVLNVIKAALIGRQNNVNSSVGHLSARIASSIATKK